MKKINLFTSGYPYSISMEDPFIKPEIKILSKFFKVKIIPLLKGKKLDEEIKNLNNIIIDNSFSSPSLLRKIKYMFKCLVCKKFYIEFFTNIFIFIKNPKLVIKLLKHTSLSILVKDWIEYKIKLGEFSEEDLYYTYWFTHFTTGLIWSRKNIKVITRTHRYDLYEERNGGYIPYRKDDVKRINYIFTVSENGKNYMVSKYKIKNVKTFYLGIPDRKIVNPINKEDSFNLISCSILRSEKRVDLIFLSLNIFSQKYKIKVKWYHIGSGEQFKYLLSLIQNNKSPFIEVILLGYLENDKVYELYRTFPFDFFITLSSSEGLPVSVMEAISCGIPVIATNVGGIPEIVKDGINGFLVESNSSIEDIVKVIYKSYNFKKIFYNDYLKMRIHAKKIFEEKFNSEINHNKFANFLLELCK